jgi:two-component system response regulator HydG
MTPATQAKLLRVLQEQAFEPVGGTETLIVDVRIVAATNKNLAEEIKALRFREDLFFRLNVVQVEVPPLRERAGDTPLLAEHFLKAFAEKNKRHFNGFTPRAMDCLIRYDWPGNIRELANVIERAVILEKGDRITPVAFPPHLQSSADAVDDEQRRPSTGTGRTLKEMERDMILDTLSSLNGNRTQTAHALGISRRTLQNKLKEYGVN